MKDLESHREKLNKHFIVLLLQLCACCKTSAYSVLGAWGIHPVEVFCLVVADEDEGGREPAVPSSEDLFWMSGGRGGAAREIWGTRVREKEKQQPPCLPLFLSVILSFPLSLSFLSSFPILHVFTAIIASVSGAFETFFNFF